MSRVRPIPSPWRADAERRLDELPAELRRLIRAWRDLEFAASPGTKMVEFGVRNGKTGEFPMPDQARRALRAYAEAKRKEIGRLADRIMTRVREVRTCRTCKAENDARASSCEACGASFRKASGSDT